MHIVFQLLVFQGVINLRVENGKVDQQTRIASISPTTAEKGKGSCKLEILPQSETCSALLVNLLLSQGKPGKVKLIFKFEQYILLKKKSIHIALLYQFKKS